MKNISHYKSNIGTLEIIVENNTLISLKPTLEMYQNYTEIDFIKLIKLQLDEYFAGKRKNFDININPSGTDFQKKVWNELLKIPYGKTTSYIEIAEKFGNRNYSRAVGNACHKNPIMLIIPCHRVISKSGKLSGFAYGTNIKEKLLQFEYEFEMRK